MAVSAETPPSVWPSASNVISATTGGDDTLRTASIAATSSSRSKNVSSMSRSTPRPSRICACSLKCWLCSATSNRSTSPIGPIEPAM